MYDINALYEGKTIENTINLMKKYPEAILIAGGSDVLIKVREGKMAGSTLISINGIKELEGISIDENENIIIKPLTTFTKITYNSIIQEHLPMLGMAVDQVGGPQLRNVATIGGNICNGVTSADSASTLFTLNAILEITGVNGKRTIHIEDFYKGHGKVDLGEGELLTAIIITKENYKGFEGHYIKYAMRDAMDIATLGCAVSCKLNEEKDRVEDVRVAFGVAGPIPMRCHETEEELKNCNVDNDLIKNIGELTLKEVNPRNSWRASKDFRLHLVKELSGRALKEAILLGGGTLND